MPQDFDATFADGATEYDEIEEALRVYTPNIALEPGDRTGGALPSRRGRTARRGLLLLTIVGAGAAVYSAPGYWLQRWTEAYALATAALEQMKPAEPPAAAQAAPSSPPTQAAAAHAPAEQAPSPAPPVTEIAAEKPLQEAALPPSATPADEPAAKPDQAEPLHPLRKRAEAAGLHPDLSLTLLKELSDADFSNARAAIRTALAETPETQDYVWPTAKAAKPGLAIFTVTFVQGAGAGCRRYVVTIAKKGWLTTAPAVEKCTTAHKTG